MLLDREPTLSPFIATHQCRPGAELDLAHSANLTAEHVSRDASGPSGGVTVSGLCSKNLGGSRLSNPSRQATPRLIHSDDYGHYISGSCALLHATLQKAFIESIQLLGCMPMFLPR